MRVDNAHFGKIQGYEVTKKGAQAIKSYSAHYDSRNFSEFAKIARLNRNGYRIASVLSDEPGRTLESAAKELGIPLILAEIDIQQMQRDKIVRSVW